MKRRLEGARVVGQRPQRLVAKVHRHPLWHACEKGVELEEGCDHGLGEEVVDGAKIMLAGEDHVRLVTQVLAARLKGGHE